MTRDYYEREDSPFILGAFIRRELIKYYKKTNQSDDGIGNDIKIYQKDLQKIAEYLVNECILKGIIK